jgi:chitinase
LRKAISTRKILTIAAAPCKNFAIGYDIPAMLPEVDFFNVMLYNFHGGGWQNLTANHCNYWHPKSNYNLITCINYWTSSGAPHNKVVIGIATHGRNYQLDDPEKNEIGVLATFKDFGKPGELPTTFSYNIICKNILENGWTRRYEKNGSSGPYAFKGKTWTGYDDLESIKQKAVLVKKVNFLGVMFWSLDHDDFSNVCGDGTFPLIKSVWNVIMN